MLIEHECEAKERFQHAHTEINAIGVFDHHSASKSVRGQQTLLILSEIVNKLSFTTKFALEIL